MKKTQSHAKPSTRKSAPRKLLTGLAIVLSLVLLVLVGVNGYVLAKARPRLFSSAELGNSGNTYDAIMVLGAAAANNTASAQLEDRLLTGIALYEAGVAPKLLLTGDNSGPSYNEVGVMRDFALAAGVPAEDIFLDHHGFSTYESVVRAEEIFRIERMVIVSQAYHLARSLDLADQMPIEAVAVRADLRSYQNMFYYRSREALARVKDFALGRLRLQTYITGPTIPLSGDGRNTFETN